MAKITVDVTAKKRVFFAPLFFLSVLLVRFRLVSSHTVSAFISKWAFKYTVKRTGDNMKKKEH